MKQQCLHLDFSMFLLLLSLHFSSKVYADFTEIPASGKEGKKVESGIWQKPEEEKEKLGACAKNKKGRRSPKRDTPCPKKNKRFQSQQMCPGSFLFFLCMIAAHSHPFSPHCLCTVLLFTLLWASPSDSCNSSPCHAEKEERIILYSGFQQMDAIFNPWQKEREKYVSPFFQEKG